MQENDLAKRCIIIGASHAGSQLALQLRQQGWRGDILVIGDEDCLPYHRPPLSKAFLGGEKTIDDLLIFAPEAYRQARIEFKPGARVNQIDRRGKRLTLSSGDVLRYDKLALTTGARVRKIPFPGAEHSGVNYLRTLADVEAVKRHARSGGNAVIIGGGYIGLETAAKLRQMGMGVTVLETLPRVLQRVTASQVSDFYVRLHREEGVTIITDTVVETLEGAGKVSGVSCQDGSHYPADLVVIGVGVIPETNLAEQAGLAVDNGIVVDEYARTSDPDIVAAGDCASHYNAIYQRQVRLESVQNATDQARVAAATLCGKLEPYTALPWFWSDQYDVKLQIAGLSQGYDEVVIRGDIDRGRSFAAFYLKERRLIAVDAVNRPREFMLSKRIITEGVPVDPDILRNQAGDLKVLM